MKQKDSISYRVFTVCNYAFLALAAFACLYPMYYVVIASFSDGTALIRHNGTLWLPAGGFTAEAYRRVLDNKWVISGYKNTLIVLTGGVSLNIVMTIMGAYFLSLKRMRMGTGIMLLILCTNYFSGGMIPGYLNVKSFGLLDSLWALILPGAVATYNMIIMRTAFAAVPDSLIESARLDGARHYRVLFSIVVPLCMPTIAVIVLYYAVGHWNSWFAASIYLLSREKYPLQLIMREILILTQMADMVGTEDAVESARVNEIIKYALIVVGTAPILALYPFLQRFFVKGVMIGAVKG